VKNVRRGEIYFADLSPVVGCEQGGYRPVICIQNDTGNLHSQTIIVAAMTSKKEHNPLPTHVHIVSEGLKRDTTVLLEQIRTIDKCRLKEYVGKADRDEMEKIDKAIATSMGIEALEGLCK